MSRWDCDVRRLLRAAASVTLLVGALASSLASHNHSFLESDDSFSQSASGTEQFLTRHNPLSRGVHCHAVIGLIHEHDCVACHAQRLPGALAQTDTIEPISPSRAAVGLSPTVWVTASLLSSGSRAPPTLI